MDTTQRLKAIEARAEALGWGFSNSHMGFKLIHPSGMRKPEQGFNIGHYDFGRWEPGIQAAERLLTLHEPGPTVTIDPPTKHDPPRCNPAHCPMGRKCPYVIRERIPPGRIRETSHTGYTLFHPGDDCPGPGTYKLVPMDGDE